MERERRNEAVLLWLFVCLNRFLPVSAVAFSPLSLYLPSCIRLDLSISLDGFAEVIVRV